MADVAWAPTLGRPYDIAAVAAGPTVLLWRLSGAADSLEVSSGAGAAGAGLEPGRRHARLLRTAQCICTQHADGMATLSHECACRLVSLLPLSACRWIAAAVGSGNGQHCHRTAACSQPAPLLPLWFVGGAAGAAAARGGSMAAGVEHAGQLAGGFHGGGRCVHVAARPGRRVAAAQPHRRGALSGGRFLRPQAFREMRSSCRAYERAPLLWSPLSAAVHRGLCSSACPGFSLAGSYGRQQWRRLQMRPCAWASELLL